MKKLATDVLGILMVAGAILYASWFVIPWTISVWWFAAAAAGGVLGVYLNTTR